MFKILVYLTLSLLILTSSLLAQGNVSPIVNSEGEKLTFSVNYMGMPVGRSLMTFSKENTPDTYSIEVKTQSFPFFSLFYQVEDRIKSTINNQFQTCKFEKYLQEGNYTKNETIIFDHQENLAYVNKHPVKIPTLIYDPLSALYQIRQQELIIGNSSYLNVISSKNIYKLEIEVLKKERLYTLFGEISTIVIKPKMLFEGIFKHCGEILIWLTDDSFKIPVLIKSKIPLGSIYAVLIKREIPLK
ncbi:DUF3108 domain-containing protein [bacterium]|nr:DUF3108 domain-containing protein [bacterium]MBU1153752.1 DUF3108 domain-containing protein [bacterium]